MSLDQRSMKSLLAGSKSAHFAAFPQQTRREMSRKYTSLFFFFSVGFMKETLCRRGGGGGGREGGGHFDVQPGFTELLLSFSPCKAALVAVVGCD